MNTVIKESDWKRFKKIKEQALERFCREAMADFEEAIGKKDCSNYEKLVYLSRLVENTDKRLSLLFDDHRRSKARLQLVLLRREGLVKGHELDGLSDELIKFTDPK